MTLTNRLAGDWTRLPFVVIERERLRGRRRPLEEILSELRDDLYRHDAHPTGLVILSPGRMEAGMGYQAMVLDTSVTRARARAETMADKLLRVMGVADIDPERR